MFTELPYAARTWRRARRVIVRIEHVPKGRTPRLDVTDLVGEANELYGRVFLERLKRITGADPLELAAWPSSSG